MADHPRQITITPALNGFIVQVGCQTVAMKNVGELSGEIARYYSSPAETEADYLKKAVNKTMDRPQLVRALRDDREMREPAPTSPDQCCDSEAPRNR